MIMKLLLVYLLLINAAGLLLMLADKVKARKNLWRIPEAILLCIAVLGGSIGCLAGMRLFHHKTLHPKFSIGVPVIIALQITFLIFVYSLIQ